MKSDNVGLHSPLSNISHHLSRWCLDGDLMSQGTNTGTPRAAGTTLKVSNHPNHFLFDKRKIGLIIEQKLSYWLLQLEYNSIHFGFHHQKKTYSEKLLINVFQEVNALNKSL